MAEDSLKQVAASAPGAIPWALLRDVPVDDEPLSDRELAALRRFEAGARSGRPWTEQDLPDRLVSSKP